MEEKTLKQLANLTNSMFIGSGWFIQPYEGERKHTIVAIHQEFDMMSYYMNEPQKIQVWYRVGRHLCHKTYRAEMVAMRKVKNG